MTVAALWKAGRRRIAGGIGSESTYSWADCVLLNDRSEP